MLELALRLLLELSCVRQSFLAVARYHKCTHLRQFQIASAKAVLASFEFLPTVQSAGRSRFKPAWLV